MQSKTIAFRIPVSRFTELEAIAKSRGRVRVSLVAREAIMNFLEGKTLAAELAGMENRLAEKIDSLKVQK